MVLNMKVLWLCNILLPAIAKEISLPYSNREGWLSGTYERLKQEKNSTVELAVCFPVMPADKAALPGDGWFAMGGTRCYGFAEELGSPEKDDLSLEEEFGRILEAFKPDLVHIFGTEFPHAYAMAKAYGRPERTLVGIQGLCYVCAEVYMADLPDRVCSRATFRDRLRDDSLRRQQDKFRQRGEREKKLLKMVSHIAGRTAFDREYTMRIAGEQARYHLANETMRAPFYEGHWKEEKHIPHSIFLSQGDYPLKGFHYALHAMPRILESYPDAVLYVAGNDITAHKTLKDKLKLSSYGMYLLELIQTYGLENKVTMLGKLSAEEMKEWYLKTSLYLCPSILENSPNSLCEAMLLGQPVVAAAVGGVESLLDTEAEGLLFEGGNADHLAESVIAMWNQEQKAGEMGEAARKRAHRTHDADANYRRLLELYDTICAIRSE